MYLLIWYKNRAQKYFFCLVSRMETTPLLLSWSSFFILELRQGKVRVYINIDMSSYMKVLYV